VRGGEILPPIPGLCRPQFCWRSRKRLCSRALWGKFRGGLSGLEN
jgi:hypothetical protein